MKRWWRFLIVVWLGIILSLRFDQSLQAQTVPSNLVQQAQTAYQLGEFEQSIKLLGQANRVYQNQGKYLQQAQILSLTSLAQQQLGNWKLAEKNITDSMTLMNSVSSSKDKNQVLAQIWNTQGHFQFSTGNYPQALASWQTAEELYSLISDRLGVAGSLLNQAEVLETMGFYRRGCDRALAALDFSEYSCEALASSQLATIIQRATADTQPWEIEALNSMSNSLLLMGNTSEAIALTEASQAIDSAGINSSPLREAKTWLSLGNINKAIAFQAKEIGNYQDFEAHTNKAQEYYQKLINTPAPHHLANKYKISAQLNLLSLLVITKQWSPAQKLVKTIDIHEGQNLYASLKFAQDLERLKENNLELDYSWQDIAEIYLDTIEGAKAIGDRRVQSYALGNLGILQSKQPDLNLDTTPQQLIEQALSLSQQIQALEISYRWQWKLGQIYRQQHNRENAIASYQASLATLADLRSDLTTLTKEVQFSFSEQIEPIYRELTDLLLTLEDPSDADLEMARNVIEGLQIAELDNYFQDACLMFEPRSIDLIDPKAAIIYTIVLPDRLEVIMATNNYNSHPNNSDLVFHHHSKFIAQTDLETTVKQLRQYISEPDRTREVQQLSAQIYDWLIRPLVSDLETEQPDTLVFVLDSILQSVPMSVLYDGNQYLLEKYALALTPSLRLLNPQISVKKSTYVAGGISQSLQVGNYKFSPLDSVETELSAFPQDSSKIVLNQKFTPENLLEQINNTSASHIHIATHGQFSSNPNQSFLLMWQELLTIKEFSQILLKRQKIVTVPIDLLVLSACDTAIGDRRAALGLAGIAVRSGALSTVATLWQVNDESTAILMKNFYQNLQDHQNKAKALQQAQLQLWKIDRKDWQVPAFWSSYVLIGNWLS